MPQRFRSSSLVPSGFVVEHLNIGPDRVGVVVRLGAPTAACPSCGAVSRRVQSRYRRCAADLPFGGRRVELLVVVRRFRCDAVLCGRQIFAERFGPDTLPAFARRTGRLERVVHHLGLALGGRPAASLAERLSLPVSRDTLKGGLGTASHRVPGTEVVVGAVVAVNAVGDVLHPGTHQILAGARKEEGRGFRDTAAAIMQGHRVVVSAGANTTIGAVATNVPFTKAEMTKIAQMAQDGLARAISPVHTMSDGDTIFALSTGKAANIRADVSALGAIAAVVMAHAVARAVMAAESLPEHNLPAHRDYAR